MEGNVVSCFCRAHLPSQYHRTLGSNLVRNAVSHELGMESCSHLNRYLLSHDRVLVFTTVFVSPVPRLVSAYFYCQEVPEDQLCATIAMKAGDVDLLAFAEHWGNYGLLQFALANVAPEDVLGTDVVEKSCLEIGDRGDECLPGWYRLKQYLDGLDQHGDCVPQKSFPQSTAAKFLLSAQEVLGTQYAAVGIIEDWETTMRLFDAALGLPGIQWHQEFQTMGVKNSVKTYAAEEHEALKQAWNDPELKKFIWLDIILYDHAVAVHTEQAKKYGL